MSSKTSALLAVALLCVLMIGSPGAKAQALGIPAIETVVPNFATSPAQITITGQHLDENLFGPQSAPTVQLAGTQLHVLSSSASTIVAQLPAGVTSGEFLLTVEHKTFLNGWFDLTLGAIGATGPAGPQGPAGAQGPQGLMGFPGIPGATGPQGLPGPAGVAGPAGATGPPGSVGPPGPQGTAGATGPIGPAGVPGAPGPQGPAGPAGATGPAGSAGTVGATGATGPPGAVGPPGTPGAAGATGTAGPQGPTGPTGPAGPAGPPGSSTEDPKLVALAAILGPPATVPPSRVFGSVNSDTCTIGQIIFTAYRATGGAVLPADGSLLPISTNSVLFAVLGNTFGGDGTTTFALPNLQAYAPTGLYYSVCVSGIFPGTF
jgi:Phage Tail Collar Domain/Collagen triple helix repeat (20 copies)/IPT/TIG domain